MKPNPRFLKKPLRFWSNVKLVSEQIGYSIRVKKKDGPKVLRTYTLADVMSVYKDEGLNLGFLRKEEPFFIEVIKYMNYRAASLSTKVQPLLMDRKEAKQAYEALLKKTRSTRLPSMNKQTGEKAHPAYLASMVSLIAERRLGQNFIEDARRLAVISRDGIAECTLSRRYDGAMPSLVNPKAVWEIKEYYGTRTFGSRVADGVYETLLDGFEINETERATGHRIKHFLFVDDRFTWWDCGRSYLCRMVDMLHTGHVDEIFFGREVLTDWDDCLRQL